LKLLSLHRNSNRELSKHNLIMLHSATSDFSNEGEVKVCEWRQWKKLWRETKKSNIRTVL